MTGKGAIRRAGTRFRGGFAVLAFCTGLLLATTSIPDEAGGAELQQGGQMPGDRRGPERESPKTRAEATEYEATSTHTDVLEFLAALQRAGAPFLIESLGTSTEGREIPLVVVADPPVTSSAVAHRSGRAIVYLQANIHGGEVEGKESTLMLLRALARGKEPHILEKLVLVVCPLYNADGNDAWGPSERNRPGQNGPETIGRRPNGQGLDLNRDCMKAESPEMRGVLAEVYGRWNPDVVIDLHTTNGTRHGYDLTYSPPLGPDTEPGVLSFTRDRLLPEVRRRLREEHGIETFDYGNVDSRAEEPRWQTFSPLPRFVTNYAGSRNRIGVLSEAASFLPFRRRVEATDRFVRAVLAYCSEHSEEIVALTRQADALMAVHGRRPDTAPSFGVSYELASRGEEEVLLEKGAADASRQHGAPRPEDIERVTLPVDDRFVATRSARLPRAYFLPASFPEAVELLRRHGIVVERIDEEIRVAGERSVVRELTVAERPFQGHRLVRVVAEREPEERSWPAGSYRIRTAQPLALLAFQLLEPEGEDGLTAWGFFDRGLRPGRGHPVWRTDAETPVAARVVAPPGSR